MSFFSPTGEECHSPMQHTNECLEKWRRLQNKKWERNKSHLKIIFKIENEYWWRIQKKRPVRILYKKIHKHINMWYDTTIENYIKCYNVLKCFSNDGICSRLHGVINKFSLETEKLKEKYKDSELLLIFLETEVIHKRMQYVIIY